MKKFVTIALFFMLFCPFNAQGVSAKIFPDLVKVSWAEEEILFLSQNGVINGMPDGTFGPNKDITRADVALMLVRNLYPSESPKGTAPFTDLSKNKYFYDAVTLAYEKGIINGYGEKVKPTQPITRAEAAVMVDRAYSINRNGSANGFPDAQNISWATESILDLNSQGIINGMPDGNFLPNKNITRAEFAKVLAATVEPAFRPEAYTTLPITSELVSSLSDQDDVHWNSWDEDSMFNLTNGKTSAKGIGFEPYTYSDEPDRMHTEFYIEEYDYTTFEATVSLEKSWTTGDKGITEAVIYADSKKIFSKTFHNTSEPVNVKAAIPAGTTSLTLYAVQQKGSQGNHGLIYDNPRLTNSLDKTQKLDQIGLYTIGTANFSDSDDAYYGKWSKDPFQMKEENLVAVGYGFEPYRYSNHPDRMYREFSIKDCSYTTLKTTISIDAKWDMGDLGVSQAVIYADDKRIYSKKFTNTSPSEDVQIQIPEGTDNLTLYVIQDAGSQGNHGVIFENPVLTNSLPAIQQDDFAALFSLGTAKTSYSGDVHYGVWDFDRPMAINGELIANGYGFEPSSNWRSNPDNMYADFYIGDYSYSKFKTTIALDSKHTEGDRGSMTAYVLADGAVLYQDTFDKSNMRKDIELPIPAGTEYLQIKASTESDNDGNRAIIFSDSILTD